MTYLVARFVSSRQRGIRGSCCDAREDERRRPAPNGEADRLVRVAQWIEQAIRKVRLRVRFPPRVSG